jgi:hypothetical protein
MPPLSHNRVILDRRRLREERNDRELSGKFLYCDQRTRSVASVVCRRHPLHVVILCGRDENDFVGDFLGRLKMYLQQPHDTKWRNVYDNPQVLSRNKFGRSTWFENVTPDEEEGHAALAEPN